MTTSQIDPSWAESRRQAAATGPNAGLVWGEYLPDEDYAQLPDQDWCEECDGPSDIVETGFETDGYDVHETEYHVIRLACGHSIANAISRQEMLFDSRDL